MSIKDAKEKVITVIIIGIILFWLMLLLGTMILMMIPELGSIMLNDTEWETIGILVVVTNVIIIAVIAVILVDYRNNARNIDIKTRH